MIHYDCTTGIEAAIMRTPVLSYQSVTNTTTEKSLPQIVSESTTTREGVKEWIVESAVPGAEHVLDERQKSEVRRYFPNIDRLAAPLICDSVDSSVNDRLGYSGYKVTTKQRIERRIKSSPIGTDVVDMYDRLRDAATDGGFQELRANRRKKFPGIPYPEIERRANSIATKVGISDIHIKQISQTDHTYSIQKK
jgi:hypothetical protein